MIALVGHPGLPCSYGSSYLVQQGARGQVRSASDAMPAWVEAYLPALGCIGFDPTNNTLADERHVRVATGRDYADVTPTRGVLRGNAESELAVTIRFAPSQVALTEEIALEPTWITTVYEAEERDQIQQQLMPQQQESTTINS